MGMQLLNDYIFLHFPSLPPPSLSSSESGAPTGGPRRTSLPSKCGYLFLAMIALCYALLYVAL